MLFFNTVCLLFITMFVYAAVSKWMDFNVFVSQMHKQPFPAQLLPLLVWGIPFTELCVSLLLMLEKTRFTGLKIATGMMILFTGYIILIELRYFGEIPCSCGGAIVQFTWVQHLYFNLFFVSIGLVAILLIRKMNIFSR
ncbi:MauE/DoxX family redox-associated membrane protein [[Flexibacter] sp. ATCC 35208]|uniref:MauE/DoxX family redox-associated membrane protein n=2 Tax=unclassified Chitinophaga TaxID=2619133 RepID=UPI0034D298A2